MHNHRILVRNVTSLSEARYVASMGASMIALPITDFNNDTGIDLERAVSIVNWISGVDILLEIPKIDETASLGYIANKAGDSGLIISGFYINQITKQQFIQFLQDSKENNFSYFFVTNDNISFKGNNNIFIVRNEVDNFETEISNENQFFEINTSDVFNPLVLKKFGGVVLSGTPEAVTGLHNFDNLETIFEQLEKL